MLQLHSQNDVYCEVIRTAENFRTCANLSAQRGPFAGMIAAQLLDDAAATFTAARQLLLVERIVVPPDCKCTERARD